MALLTKYVCCRGGGKERGNGSRKACNVSQAARLSLHHIFLTAQNKRWRPRLPLSPSFTLHVPRTVVKKSKSDVVSDSVWCPLLCLPENFDRQLKAAKKMQLTCASCCKQFAQRI